MPKCEVNEFGRECARCKAFQPWTSYLKHDTGVNGYRATCKSCAAKIHKEKKEARKAEEIKAQRYNPKRAFLIERIHLKRAA